MKKPAVLVSIAIILLAVPSFAMTVANYDINIAIKGDSSIRVSERIAVDFGYEPHHGINRDIPLSQPSSSGSVQKYRLEDISVTDADGKSIQYDKQTTPYGELRLRIGDPDEALTGAHTYLIAYTVQRAIHYLSDRDELYWNAIGRFWPVPIEHASCVVTLPADLPSNKIHTNCYTGYLGSTDADASTKIIDGRTVKFELTKPLETGQALSVVVGWPKGIVGRPQFLKAAGWFVSDYGFLVLPVVFLIFCFGLLWNSGRDPEVHEAETVQSDPPDGLGPAELGTVLTERLETNYITAEIVHLAAKGYIRIEQSDGAENKLHLTGTYITTVNDPKLTPFESDLIKTVFAGQDTRASSDLAGTFTDCMSNLVKRMYSSLVDAGYFPKSPDAVRTSYAGPGALILFAGVFLVIAFLNLHLPFLPWAGSIITCGIMLMITGQFMPRRTEKGRELLIRIRGFREFIKQSEKDQAASEKDPKLFEKLVPYAIAFGIADQWGKAFEGSNVPAPIWYTGYPGLFSPYMFTNHLNSTTHDWNTSMNSMPDTGGGFDSSSGGGGFAGGGDGGGGGSAW
jgi:uncharacterized membrane protein YgcG